MNSIFMFFAVVVFVLSCIFVGVVGCSLLVKEKKIQGKIQGLCCMILAMIFFILILHFTEKQSIRSVKLSNISVENKRIEILKDFYDGKPVKRSEAFWEIDFGYPGWAISIEIMAKKYALDAGKVKDEIINNQDQQYLIYSPSGPPKIEPTEFETEK